MHFFSVTRFDDYKLHSLRFAA